MLFKTCEISAVEMNGFSRFVSFRFAFVRLSFCRFVQERLCFHTHPLTHVRVTDLGAAAGRWAAPPGQWPAVKVPCWRALRQWSQREDLCLCPGNQTSDFQLVNCDHSSSSALHHAVTVLTQKLCFSFHSFLKVWFLFFFCLYIEVLNWWCQSHEVVYICRYFCIRSIMILKFLSVMDFLRQSTRCVDAAPVALVSSVPV